MAFAETGTLATGLYDFEGVRDDNLPFKKGEVITIIEMNDTGWWKGVNTEGRVGIFPYNYVEARAEEIFADFRIVKAIAPFQDVGMPEEARDNVTEGQMLNFELGDLITILKPVDDDWSLGKLHTTADDNNRVTERVVGRFPLSYVEETGKVDDTAEQEEQEYHEKQKELKLKIAQEKQEERIRIEKEKEVATHNERKRLAEEEKKEQQLAEEKDREEQKRIEMEEQIVQSRLMAQRTATEQAILAAEALRKQQQDKEQEMKEERERMQEEMKRMKEKIAAYESEVLASRQAAARAEEELVAAQVEAQRLIVVAEKRQSHMDEEARERITERSRLVMQKAMVSVNNFAQQDGFSSPPPLAEKPNEKPKYVKNPKFAHLGRGESCKKCNKGVASFGPSGLKAIGASWHRDCFTCSTCSKVLRSTWNEHNGFPYCTKCHRQGFGITGFGFGGAVTGKYS